MDFKKYSLEFSKKVNNQTNHKRLTPEHRINKVDVENSYKSYMPFFEHLLKRENDAFDILGDEDLLKYEKWLVDNE